MIKGRELTHAHARTRREADVDAQFKQDEREARRVLPDLGEQAASRAPLRFDRRHRARFALVTFFEVGHCLSSRRPRQHVGKHQQQEAGNKVRIQYVSA